MLVKPKTVSSARWVEVLPGLYDTGSFNSHIYLTERLSMDERYPRTISPAHTEHNGEEIPDILPWYGVCDTIQQFAEYDRGRLAALPEPYFVSFACIERKDQPADGGWRYHKWGPYIGKQNPECEYIYDDKHIDRVYVFTIYKLREGMYNA